MLNQCGNSFIPTVRWCIWHAGNCLILRDEQIVRLHLMTNVIHYINLWTGISAAKKIVKLQKAIELMNFPSFFQGTDKEEAEVILRANSI